MARLVYSAITSLDGYVADQEGDFSWSAPDEEVHAFVNDLLRPVGTHLYGRRMYEVLVAWETMPTGPDAPAVVRDFAEIWRSADKVVFSTSLPAVTSARTRLERHFDPDAVRRLVASSDRDVSIGGPHLAARRSTPGSSTTCTCSGARSWSAAARPRCPTGSASTWSPSPRTSSATASCTCSTACGASRRRPTPDEPPMFTSHWTPNLSTTIPK